jgi:tRNA threonylcarbamoyladenosine biosynthesis protein TsaE
MIQNKILNDEQATLDFAQSFAHSCPEKGIIFLHGSLGAGKTTFVRGVLNAFGYNGAVKSPTYTLVEPYQLKQGTILYHFDLYRLSDPEELEYIGIRDYFEQSALIFIEWAENGKGFLPKPNVDIYLNHHHQARSIQIIQHG